MALSYYDQLKVWARADDMRGFDCLGADPVVAQSLAQQQQALQAMKSSLAIVDQSAQGILAQDAQRKKAAATVSTLAIAGVVGGVVGGVGGALLWPAHRIIGFLIGSIVVGGPAGAGVGVAIAAQKAAK